jgi:hypothetical protein
MPRIALAMNAGERLSRDSQNASVLGCTWQRQDAVVKLVQPQVVVDSYSLLVLQKLMVNEAQQYTGRLAVLQGALPCYALHGYYFT